MMAKNVIASPSARNDTSCAPSCYVCGVSCGEYRLRLGGTYSICKCPRCGLEYTHPRPAPQKICAFYARYQDLRSDPRIVRLRAKEDLKLLKKHGWTARSQVLDYGAGKGFFVRIAGKECFGIELHQSGCPRIKQSFSRIPGSKWDFITLWGVIEHLSYPRETLIELAGRLKIGGYIALTTVNAEGEIPYYYKPPEHLCYWTKDAFSILAKEAGLSIAVYQPYQMSQLSSVYLKRLLSRTPRRYHRLLSSSLPHIVRVPTNEVRVLMRKKK